MGQFAVKQNNNKMEAILEYGIYKRKYYIIKNHRSNGGEVKVEAFRIFNTFEHINKSSYSDHIIFTKFEQGEHQNSYHTRMQTPTLLTLSFWPSLSSFPCMCCG